MEKMMVTWTELLMRMTATMIWVMMKLETMVTKEML